MSSPYRLTADQMARLRPFFPQSHGCPRVDDRRVPGGIIFISINGLRGRDGKGMNAIGSRDCPNEGYGPAQTLDNR